MSTKTFAFFITQLSEISSIRLSLLKYFLYAKKKKSLFFPFILLRFFFLYFQDKISIVRICPLTQSYTTDQNLRFKICMTFQAKVLDLSFSRRKRKETGRDKYIQNKVQPNNSFLQLRILKYMPANLLRNMHIFVAEYSQNPAIFSHCAFRG